MTKYQLHKQTWAKCTACSLSQGRCKVVFARGDIPCDVLFVGEAPGRSEDILGKPFVGPAGKLLDQIIEHSIGGWTWEKINDEGYEKKIRIAFYNAVSCYPKEQKETANHEPPEEAIEACQAKLIEFVRIAKPKLIIRVGKTALKSIPGQSIFSTNQNEKSYSYGSLPWIPESQFLLFAEIVHPAAILRANISNRGLMIQKAEVVIASAVQDMIDESKVPF